MNANWHAEQRGGSWVVVRDVPSARGNAGVDEEQLVAFPQAVSPTEAAAIATAAILNYFTNVSTASLHLAGGTRITKE